MSDTSFDLHGAQFWDKNGPYRTLHHINPARLQFIRRHIDPKGKRILDIGCGGGILTEALYHAGALVSGIDLSEAVIEAAREHAALENLAIDYRVQSTGECVAAGEQYDHVTCLEMLEHVHDPGAILRDIEALLKPGGYAFFSTINRTMKARLLAITVAEKILRLVPRGTHEYEGFIRPQELVNMAEHAGLQPIALSGMDYHPLLRRAVLSRHFNINYLFVARKPEAA
ncbi:MAG: bifunctional 2-polyprenyl-6-hydroxyphenol methylase/3-demethylubiquinol 3-O-methyltransferase UbiG [Cardiobacteriaceae bacterium]|nr:bifunctional 2-polyprenyl-6-hydroxyphenol methylase/3-demethylubiquinol 3-O-methyltransferase UbiG [Cardiobacteriaceae bacterium]